MSSVSQTSVPVIIPLTVVPPLLSTMAECSIPYVKSFLPNSDNMYRFSLSASIVSNFRTSVANSSSVSPESS